MVRVLLTLLLLAGSLAGCSLFNKEDKSNNDKKQVEVHKEKAEKTQNEKPIVTEKKAEQPEQAEQLEQQEADPDGLKNYRPKVGIKKVFVDQDNFESLTEEVVFENDDYVQSITTIGKSVSVVVYKWTDKEISIVKTVQNPDNPRKNYLDNLKADPDSEMMITMEDASGVKWKMISSNETVQTPYQTFTNVYVIQKTTNEVEGADTIYTHYLAPGVGLVKELFEVTGEQGYTAESVLKKVE
jgi:hypothetical protein